jgi:hypothetical protein
LFFLSVDYASRSVFVIVQVKCWPAAIVTSSQSPSKVTTKNGGALMPSNTINLPGCSVTRTPSPIANSHSKVCVMNGLVRCSATVISQSTHATAYQLFLNSIGWLGYFK